MLKKNKNFWAEECFPLTPFVLKEKEWKRKKKCIMFYIKETAPGKPC